MPNLSGRTAVGAGTGTKVLLFSSRSSDTITVTGAANASTNEVQTGQIVNYHTSSVAITGLTNDTNYYIIRIAYNQFKLASSLANAQNGTAISLSSDGSGTQTFTITLTAHVIGDTGGEEAHAMSSTELLAHTHTLSPVPYGTGANPNQPLTTSGGSAPSVVGSTGGNAAMNIMQPYLVTNYIIRY